jgi:hypothetical protein
MGLIHWSRLDRWLQYHGKENSGAFWRVNVDDTLNEEYELSPPGADQVKRELACI